MAVALSLPIAVVLLVWGLLTRNSPQNHSATLMLSALTVAGIGLVRSSPVDRDNAGVIFRTNGVGGKALAIVQVVNLDLLVLVDIGSCQQRPVDGTGALVLELRVSDVGMVQLGF